jgi:hypothetical protein
MAKPDAGGGNMYGGAQQAMAGANAMRQRSRMGDAMAGANQQRDAWRQANPGAGPQGPMNIPGKTMPDISGQIAAIRGLAGGNTINALQPPGPTTMQPPGGNNFFAQRLAQTGQNPAESPVAIRRPMPDMRQQFMRQPQPGGPEIPQAPMAPQAPTGFGGFRSRMRT